MGAKHEVNNARYWPTPRAYDRDALDREPPVEAVEQWRRWREAEDAKPKRRRRRR